jgi:phage baseplate assembly protein W
MNDAEWLGHDLALGFSANEEGVTVAGPATHVDLRTVQHGRVFPRAVDLATVSGRSNLVQSLIVRLETERGELAALGHPNYGSRHHQLIGEPNTESNRNLVKLYVLECLKQEPRIETVEQIDVKPGAGRENRDKVVVTAALRVRGEPDVLNLVVPFSFAGPLE